MTTQSQQPVAAPTPIFTIGYGARTLEQLVDALNGQAIEFLIDVRSAPYSRYKPEFAKEALEAALKTQGIRYLFLGDALGGRPDDPTCYVEGKVDYHRLQDKPFYRRGIDRLQSAFAQQRRVVLMCSEGKPEECHRAKLIGPTLTALGIPVMHIDENDQLCSQAQIDARLDGAQLTLFDAPTRASRKRYIGQTGEGQAGGEQANQAASDEQGEEGEERDG